MARAARMSGGRHARQPLLQGGDPARLLTVLTGPQSSQASGAAGRDGPLGGEGW